MAASQATDRYGAFPGGFFQSGPGHSLERYRAVRACTPEVLDSILSRWRAPPRMGQSG